MAPGVPFSQPREMPAEICLTPNRSEPQTYKIRNKGKKRNEVIQSSNGGVLYGADGRDPRTKCKSGRLEQEDHDDLQRSG